MAKIIELYPQEEIVEPIPYNKAIDESDYAIWKARQYAKNVSVLPINDIGGDDDE